MDEVAYHVSSIARDGTVSLRERGGVINSAWEGQPAILHLPEPATGAPDTLLGVFVPRDSARVKHPRNMTAYCSMDDRAGSTALIMAVRRIDPATLDHAVLFVWSVQEEGGLVGAQYVAERHGVSTTRIYSIDTFVSSETPLESPHFAYVSLGGGPVLRAVENGSISPLAEVLDLRDVERLATLITAVAKLRP
jgi:putative aminopeptidase FrvX